MLSFQIKNMPDDVHTRLKIRAAKAGVSMSDLIIAELRRSLEVPTREEFLAILHTHPRVELDDVGAAEIIREDRDNR